MRMKKEFYRNVKELFIEKYKADNSVNLKEFASRHNIQVNTLKKWLRKEKLIEEATTRECYARNVNKELIHHSKKAKVNFRNIRIGQKVSFGDNENKRIGIVIDKYRYFFLVKLKRVKTTLRYDDEFEIVK